MSPNPLPGDAEGTVRILFSVREPGPNTNPFTTLLVNSLRQHDGVTVDHFTWRRALTGRYDVLHVHWPEAITRGPSRLRRATYPLLTLLLLLRLKLAGTRIVRTIHNTDPHESGWPHERIVLRLIDQATDASIVMTSHTPKQLGSHRFVVPHGHYRDWYPVPTERHEPVSPSILYFGLIRDYKGVDILARVFSETAGLDDYRLRLLGKPAPSGVSPALQRVIDSDARILPDFRFVPDADLSAAITEARLVVLPYRNMHNSGAVLLALSLNTPVLVPRNPITQDLQSEFGPEAVVLFDGELTAPDLTRALAALSTDGMKPEIDMTSRNWSTIADAHLAVYRAARTW